MAKGKVVVPKRFVIPKDPEECQDNTELQEQGHLDEHFQLPDKGRNGKTKPAERLVIKPLREREVHFDIVGFAPYMQLRFSQKAIEKMKKDQEAGSQNKTKKVREKRDFEQNYKDAMYLLPDGSHGMPASAFRQAMISACRLCGFKMTIAKLSVFIEEDGRDYLDKTPLVKIVGTPHCDIRPARNANGGTDLRARPMWDEWSAKVKIRFDEDQFSGSDIFNLLVRVGRQVGIGEGRPDSRMSAGMGFGLFNTKLP